MTFTVDPSIDPVILPDHTQLPESDGTFVKNFQEHPQSILLTDSIKTGAINCGAGASKKRDFDRSITGCGDRTAAIAPIRFVFSKKEQRSLVFFTNNLFN